MSIPLNPIIIDKVIKSIHNYYRMTLEELCDNYDHNMIFHGEIMKHQDISSLDDTAFEIMNACMDAYLEKYPEPDEYPYLCRYTKWQDAEDVRSIK